MTPGAFLDKLQRYTAMKADHARKRAIVLRKPWSAATRPVAWLRRRRPDHAGCLTTDVRQLYDELQRSGFVRADTLVDTGILAKLQFLVDSRLASRPQGHTAQLSGRKDFWQMMMTAEDLHENSPLVRHALTPAIIDIITAYLGEVPYLSRLELVESKPTEGKWKVSQLWHRDYNDRKMVKLFTYFSDVDSDQQGPFTFLPADAVESGPRFPVHKTDEQMSRFGQLDKVRKVLGPRGTSFLIDTHRCFHCGSRILDDSSRIAYIATYTSSTPYYPYDNEIALLNDANPDRRMVLRI